MYGDWQLFLPTESCTSGMIFLRQTACHKGCSPVSSPLPSLFPKLPNLVPHPQPRVQPNLLPRWQPSLQLESPFLWPLWGMCSSSESNTRARQSGTQSLFLSRAEHASQQAVPHSFCCSYALCVCTSCFVPPVLCIVIGGVRELSLEVFWGMFPQGCEGTVARPLTLQEGVVDWPLPQVGGRGGVDLSVYP